LRAIQIERVRAADDHSLCFLAPALLDANARRVEIARASDPDDFEGNDDAVTECDSVQILENSGDYVLVSAQPTSAR
jgi:hypothetical protein